MLQLIRKRFTDRQEGATATEYVLLLAGIVVVIIVAVFAFGHFLSSKFTTTQTSISSAT